MMYQISGIPWMSCPTTQQTGAAMTLLELFAPGTIVESHHSGLVARCPLRIIHLPVELVSPHTIHGDGIFSTFGWYCTWYIWSFSMVNCVYGSTVKILVPWFSRGLRPVLIDLHCKPAYPLILKFPMPWMCWPFCYHQEVVSSTPPQRENVRTPIRLPKHTRTMDNPEPPLQAANSRASIAATANLRWRPARFHREQGKSCETLHGN